MENVWQYLRANKLAITVFDSYEDILDKCADAWNFFATEPECSATNKMIILGRDRVRLADHFVADKGFVAVDCRAALIQIVARHQNGLPRLPKESG
jgi:hypothetical protein